MHMTNIKLENFRCFDALEVSLHPELTIFVAENGQGKSTVLEAVAAALAPFVCSFDLGRSEHIRRTDASYGVLEGGYENEQKFPVIISAELSEPAIRWQRALQSAKSRTTTKEADPLTSWGKRMQKELRTLAEVPLPVLRYYSSKRLWVSHKNIARKAILTESRTAGYEECLSPLSSFVQLQEWVKKATQAVQQQREMPGYEKSNLASSLKGIQQAVDTVMAEEGWSDFHYSYVFDELAMVHTDHGALPISMFSDGERVMVSLVADLAFRCVRLNGYLGERAVQESKGIVLIDEVDMFLHPSWQQTIIASLKKSFPKIQFIVSTHSPQVLTTVPSECIRILKGGQVYSAPHGSEGAEPGRLLKQVLGLQDVRPIQNMATKELREYLSLVDKDQWSSPRAQELRRILDARYQGNEPELLEADLRIENRKWEMGA